MWTRRQFLGLSAGAASVWCAGDRLRALIVDGRHNHDWRVTTPLLKRALEDSGLFTVDVATAPERNEALSGFRPDFASYQVVVPNYTDLGNGGTWPEGTRDAFVSYVSRGGGVVIVHAASSAFPEWREFNEIAGLGGWGGRDERWGPCIHYRDGASVREIRPGRAGHHAKQHAFIITVRDSRHPVTAGLPVQWVHAKDELFDSLRGPAKNLQVLATAYSDPADGGSGEHEPVLFTVLYGKGRVFHTVLGHGEEALRCAGFITTFQRGAEWAAKGKVTQRIPDDFPRAQEIKSRP